MTIALIAFLSLVIPGSVLVLSTKAGTVPAWLNWWHPVTKRLPFIEITDSCSKSERIQIDGIVLIVTGFVLLIWTLLIATFMATLRRMPEALFGLMMFISIGLAILIIKYASALIMRTVQQQKGHK